MACCKVKRGRIEMAKKNSRADSGSPSQTTCRISNAVSALEKLPVCTQASIYIYSTSTQPPAALQTVSIWLRLAGRPASAK